MEAVEPHDLHVQAGDPGHGGIVQSNSQGPRTRDSDVQGQEKRTPRLKPTVWIRPSFTVVLFRPLAGGWHLPTLGRASFSSLLETPPPTPPEMVALPAIWASLCPGRSVGGINHHAVVPVTKVFIASFFSPENGFRHFPSCSSLPY